MRVEAKVVRVRAFLRRLDDAPEADALGLACLILLILVAFTIGDLL